ncbi:MAG TPA: translocation/assembly module TamB domain-containing protein [Noviherbaspirillum sp.]|uniref:translocation/assembly module TamB domain-containing protein n=1 Tax=Noviherbaspirillum sp. TaxID=1926288 RepID=UPI002B4A7640|nr:translocation/assembly module TamB domain-containing protein [Noviherbaspirillum sp.]HJV84500.1 translocation/assembly module TamB domain-containing protein [Noviherbaspirillum sp.]
MSGTSSTSDRREPPPATGRLRRWLIGIALTLLVLIALCAALAFSAWQTKWGARALWQVATRVMAGKLSGELAGGTLADGLRLRQLQYRDASRQVKVDSVTATWNWSRSPLALTIASLRIGQLDLTLLPTPPKPPSPPSRLTLPMAIDLRDASLQKLLIHRDGSTTAIGDIRLHASSDRVHHTIVLEHAGTPLGTAKASLRLAGLPPFDTSGMASLDGAWQDEHYRLDARLSGSLQALGVQVQAAGDRLSGDAQIEARPFETVPLRQAQVSVKKLNPKLFSSAAPQAELDIDARLTPSGTDTSQLALTGPVTMRNGMPGAIDKGLLPVVSAQAEVLLDAQRQQLHGLLIRLPGDARLEGGGEWRRAGTGSFKLQASGLDLHAIYSKLRPSALDGPLNLDLAKGSQHITLALSSSSLAISGDAQITAQQFALTKARLQAGNALLDLDGTLERAGQRVYAAHGSLTNFNPALFMAQAMNGKKTKSKIPDADINMDFDAQGALQPVLEAQMRFDIRDSSYAGLPMTGGGNLHLAGKRIAASDMQLAVAGNTLQLKGSFGNPGERLKFAIDAPALARLGYGLSGLLQADGELGGSLDRPVVDASYRASQLAFDPYRVAQLSGQIHTNGVPGRNPDAGITLSLDAHDAQAPDIRLASLAAAINGSYASHSIRLDTNGQMRGRPVQLSVSAQGRLQEQPQGYAWDGKLRTLENRGFPHLSMAGPLDVSAGPGRIALGAADFTLEQAHIRLTSLRIEGAQISSEGAFSALDIAHLLELRREITGAAPPVKTDLVLDGQWKFSLAESATGFFEVARRSGDVRILGGPRESALGLTALQLRGDLRGNAVDLTMQAAASRIGNASGSGRIGLQPVNGRMMPTPDSALSGRITASIPRLQSIASLAGPRIALGGSVELQLNADGSLSEPLLSGDLTGQNLALTLYDQGVRLHDGSAQIRLDNNVVDIRELVLHGGDGTVRATGRIPLDQDNPDLNATIVADKLQLLAKPSGQMTVSGQATMANINRELEVGGKFTVDHARFQLPEKSAPVLDDDVVVIRGTQRVAGPVNKSQAVPASEKAAGPFSPTISVVLDLGNDFRFEGSGAALLLAGSLTVESAPGEAPQAFGTVRIVSGTYEAFGTKLAIERGVINFQGPFANPNINIEAMRHEQDVAAGVHVTGTARQPRVQLVSEPDMPEQEKLNWLVFGRSGGSTDAGPGQAQAAAKDAALGLVNKFGGARIAKGIGLDQLSFGSSEFGLGTQQVVSLGKEISSRLFIGYEQSLAGAAGVLKLTYELSRHWSVVVRGGSIGGLDVLYSKRFDKFGEVSETR